MAFTDEELKWLKKNIATSDRSMDSGGWFLDFNEWEALLVRLEAAEALISDCPQYEPEIEEKRQAWRKSAGK